jgi:hypothetical protein
MLIASINFAALAPGIASHTDSALHLQMPYHVQLQFWWQALLIGADSMPSPSGYTAGLAAYTARYPAPVDFQQLEKRPDAVDMAAWIRRAAAGLRDTAARSDVTVQLRRIGVADEFKVQ